MLRWLKNLVMSRYGWSFQGESSSQSQAVQYEGEEATLRIRVINDGLRLGTAYVRFLVADAYRRDQPIFDSDRDLTANERQALRVIDIPVGESREVVCGFTVTAGLSGRPFDVRCQIWNPHRLFNGPRPWLFYDSGWKGAFEVVARPTHESKKLTVFVSYSHDSLDHKQWVRELVERLRTHDIDTVVDLKDLRPGKEATLFMERAVTESDVSLLICTKTYTEKANQRRAGVGFESILYSNEYLNRTPEERSRMIPVVRDNNLPSGRKLPRYLGSSVYVDLSGLDWRAGPMLTLVDAIKRHAKHIDA